MGIAQKNPDFMRPEPSPTPSPDDGGGDGPIPIHKNHVLVGLLVAILIVSGLICGLLYKKKKDKMKPVSFQTYQQYQNLGDKNK